MKSIKLLSVYSILLICFSLSQCKKHDHTTSPDNPYGLPNATQEGKNTLGFLLNGEPWTPKGFNGTANLSIDVDFGFNDGIFNIVSYKTINAITEQFTIGISDSLNFISSPYTFLIHPNSVFGISYTTGSCDYFSKDSSTTPEGTMTITKLDKTMRIISGTFSATLSRSGCETINITEGRFDMKY